MKVLLSIINANVSVSKKHKHSIWEMVYRLCGDSQTTIGDKTYLVSQGDVYLTPPETVHFDCSDGVFSDLVIQIDFLDFSDVLFFHDGDNFVLSVSKMVDGIIKKEEEYWESIADSLMDTLVQYIKRFSTSKNWNSLAQRLKKVIVENIENCDFDLAKEIKNMGYHSDYVRRCFKAETQKTPLAYLTELRMSHAKKLLIMPTYESVEIISEKCGFRDPFYFSSCFKKHIGLSPLQYRKQHFSKR